MPSGAVPEACPVTLVFPASTSMPFAVHIPSSARPVVHRGAALGSEPGTDASPWAQGPTSGPEGGTMRTSRSETTTGTGAVASRSARSPRRRAPEGTADEATPDAASVPGRNEVVLSGRLGAEAEERELPSGDRIATLRVVVPREPPSGRRRATADEPRRATVDTIDVVCWTAATRRSALRLRGGDVVEVEGALRRRFFGGAAGRQSRYEVEATALRRVSGAGRAGT